MTTCKQCGGVRSRLRRLMGSPFCGDVCKLEDYAADQLAQATRLGISKRRIDAAIPKMLAGNPAPEQLLISREQWDDFFRSLGATEIEIQLGQFQVPE